MPSARPSKRRKVASASTKSLTSGTLFTTHPIQNAISATPWLQEQDYERVPRESKLPTASRLPVRTQQGWVDSDSLINQDDPQAKHQSAQHDTTDSLLHANSSLEASQIATSPPQFAQVPHREQLLKAKEDLARLASLINQDPDEQIASLKALADIAQSTNPTIQQLAIATQCAVYKDIIPGYRIRSLSDQDLKEKVSKDVKKLRNYEQSLVSTYRHYIDHLSRLAKHGHRTAPGLGHTAISCAATLLLAVPHFNFRQDLLRIVVSPLRLKISTNEYQTSIKTLQKLFKEDDDGRPSLEAVQLITKMIKARDYHIHESLLNLFLSLQLLSSFRLRASADKVDGPQDLVSTKMKRIHDRKSFRTKRQRKDIKQQKLLDKEMDQANAVVTHEEHDKLQAETLKLVFATYFRILKAQSPHLMGAVLEGLAKYAHLINQDFFGDILEALKDLLRQSHALGQSDSDDDDHSDRQAHHTPRDATRESLLCIVTAFALLQGQDGRAAAANLNLDLSFFVTHLYRTLVPTITDPNVQLSPTSFHLPDPLASSQPPRANVNAKTKIVLLIRCLSSVLLPRVALRSVPPLRVAAFTKQLMTAALQLPEKSCQAMLGLVAQITKIHGRKIATLWNTEERRGDGVFDPLRGDIEGSNPFSSTVWEGELLRLHFSPKVKEATKIVASNIRAAE